MTQRKISKTNKITRILFLGAEHRQRRRETIDNPPKGFIFDTLKDTRSMRKDYELTAVEKERGVTRNLDKILRVFRDNNFVPAKYREKYPLIYSPGYLPFFTQPFVIEIDSVAVVAYYKLGVLLLMKRIIRKKLESNECKAIICISRAAEKSVQNYFNSKIINSKTIVVYPYTKFPKITHKVSANPNFLFISANFYLKGGKQVVDAFEKLQQENPLATLKIISKKEHIDPLMLKRIEENKGITLVEANQSKEKLFRDAYAKANIFVLPTFQDSFGMVYLEALAAGLPIIATDMFAVPEMVEHGKNGFVIPCPVPYFTSDYLPNYAWWERDKAAYARKKTPDEFDSELYKAMKSLAENKTLRQRMARASSELYKRKFDYKIRQQILEKVFTQATTRKT